MSDEILLCAATKWETAPLAAKLNLKTNDHGMMFEGQVGGKNVILLKTGIGEKKATAALEKLAKARKTLPRLACSTGLCGSLRPEIKRGDIVADVHGGPVEWPAIARAGSESSGLRLHFGAIAHSKDVAQPAEKAALAAKTRACAVDMESRAVREWAGRHRLESLSVRAVLDEADERLPGAPEGEGLDSLMRYAARNAASLPWLLATGLRARRSTTRLARFLEAILPQL